MSHYLPLVGALAAASCARHIDLANLPKIGK